MEGGTRDDAPIAAHGVRIVDLDADQAAMRVDRALADKLPELSRSRVRLLIEQGCVLRGETPIDDPSAKAGTGPYTIHLPAPVPAEPQPEAIPLVVLFEDEHLIVVDKPAGMAAHPAPGTDSGTLVNALLHHCGASLSGIGGVARPGIVHRLDKETSGVMVAAKTDVAHRGLAALFEAHDLERVYLALTRGAPNPRKGVIETQLGRSTSDRKKMAVLRAGGRRAVTHYVVEHAYGPAERPLAARVACRLETGRTHQIRVHLASKGAPCLGDPTYGSGPPAPSVRAAIAEAGLTRQALHAAVLAFVHPITGQALRFETIPPEDFRAVEAGLAKL